MDTIKPQKKSIYLERAMVTYYLPRQKSL